VAKNRGWGVKSEEQEKAISVNITPIRGRSLIPKKIQGGQGDPKKGKSKQKEVILIDVPQVLIVK